MKPRENRDTYLISTAAHRISEPSSIALDKNLRIQQPKCCVSVESVLLLNEHVFFLYVRSVVRFPKYEKKTMEKYCLMEEILHHPTCMRLCNGIFTISTGAGFLPSTVSTQKMTVFFQFLKPTQYYYSSKMAIHEQILQII